MDDFVIAIIFLVVIVIAIYAAFKGMLLLLLRILKIEKILQEIKVTQDQLSNISKNQSQLQHSIKDLEYAIKKRD